MDARAPLDTFEKRLLGQLVVDDERSFRGVAVYADLKAIVEGAALTFRVLPEASRGRWDRALLLNLTFWGAGADAGGDVLVDDHIAADVVAHVAWHHLAAQALRSHDGQASVEALFLGESIASAFDVYLVGKLLGRAPRSTFLSTQVPAMAESAMAAGLPEDEFEALLTAIATDPEAAFAELRELLFDATRALYECGTAEAALAALAGFDEHRFGPLLHHYELSNWVLYARAYAKRGSSESPAMTVDRALREHSEGALAWLVTNWVVPAVD